MASAAGDVRFDIGRVIDRGGRSLARSWLPLTALALPLAGGPAFLTELYLFQPLDGGEATAFLSTSYWLALVAGMIAAVVVDAILVRSLILSLGGRPADVVGSILLALRLLPQVLGLAVVASLMILVGLVALVVPGVIIYLMFIVAVPALVEERGGVIDSLRRSSQLTAGFKGQILVVVIAYIVLTVAVAFAVGALALPLSNALGLEPVWGSAAAQSVSAAIQALVNAAMIAALYVELREVKEGATTGRLAEVFA